VVVGEGPERGRLEALARDEGLGETVVFVGAQPHGRIAAFLASFDVAVSSSDFEGGPLAVLEYMAAGKAIVATRVGGLPDLIDDGVEGLLVPRRNPAELASAIERLLDDSALRAELATRARERQQREFDLGTTIRRLETLYESLYWASPRGRREAARGLTYGELN
jgi:glycosyltransferase involved in cell wall biosynthesis